jgi:hypothetical protein
VTARAAPTFAVTGAAPADVDIQNLEYVPFMRHMLAGRLEACAGPGLCEALNGLAQDRRWGGFTTAVPKRTKSAGSSLASAMPIASPLTFDPGDLTTAFDPEPANGHSRRERLYRRWGRDGKSAPRCEQISTI